MQAAAIQTIKNKLEGDQQSDAERISELRDRIMQSNELELRTIALALLEEVVDLKGEPR